MRVADNKGKLACLSCNCEFYNSVVGYPTIWLTFEIGCLVSELRPKGAETEWRTGR